MLCVVAIKYQKRPTHNMKVLSVSLFNYADEEEFAALLGTKITLFC